MTYNTNKKSEKLFYDFTKLYKRRITKDFLLRLVVYYYIRGAGRNDLEYTNLSSS